MEDYTLSNCKKLTLFDISWEDILCEHVVPYLSLKDLFSLRCCSRESKRFVKESFKYLKEINFAGKQSPNIRKIFQILDDKCVRLEILNLARCNWVYDQLIVNLLKNNYSLVYVNLRQCSVLTASCLQPIILQCKRLKTLNLRECLWMTPGAMEALTLHHDNLIDVDISGCFSINKSCLTIFCVKFCLMETLAIERLPFVTDDLLIQISSKCKGLKFLSITGCFQITNVGIFAIAENCKNLCGLMVKSCPLVTEAALTKLRGKIYIDRRPNEFY